MVTSRDRLAGVTTRHAAHRVALAPLTAAEAVRLLGAVVGPERVAAEPAAAAALVELCDRLPLATTIAAERVAQAPDVPIAEVAAELDGDQRRLDLLESAGDLTTSMRTVLGRSYRALPPAAQRLFRLSAAHPAHEFDVAAAAAAAGVPVTSGRRDADTLAGLHLARRVPGSRVAVHDLVGEYARELFAAEPAGDRDDARARLLEWYLHSIAHACATLDPRTRPVPLAAPGPGIAPLEFATRDEALRWCEAERRSVPAVAEAAARAGRYESVRDLAALYWTYLDLRGRPNDVNAVCRLALESARAVGDHHEEALQLNRLGISHLLLGEFDRAEEQGLAALALDRKLGDTAAEAETLTNLARILVAAERPLEAARMCEAALDRLDRPEAGWRAWNNLAMARMRAGQVEAALAAVDKALHASDLHRHTGDRQQMLDAVGMQAYSRETRARVWQLLGRCDEALADFRHAHRTAVDLGEWRLEAEALIGAGEVLHKRGEIARAHRVWTSALEVYTDVEAHTDATGLRHTMTTCCTEAASAS